MMKTRFFHFFPYIFILYSRCSLWKCQSETKSLELTVNKYWFFVRVVFNTIFSLSLFYFLFVLISFCWQFLQLQHFYVFHVHKILLGLIKEKWIKWRILFILALNVLDHHFFVDVVSMLMWSNVQTNFAFVVLCKCVCPIYTKTMFQ